MFNFIITEGGILLRFVVFEIEVVEGFELEFDLEIPRM